MANVNSSSDQPVAMFKPFSWLSADAQYLPLASFAAKTFDIAQGISLIMEMIEDTQLCEDEEGRSPMLSGGQCGVLQRMVIATADALQSEARHAMDWLDEYGVKYYAPKQATRRAPNQNDRENSASTPATIDPALAVPDHKPVTDALCRLGAAVGCGTKGREAIKAVLLQFGASKLADVHPSNYEKVLAACAEYSTAAAH
ncbi:hypothetical protein [Azonexus hydrophilus]|uniref:hypothetical protein n=1 Tax=Azonexus hydrophilus TaxID=418702 RepID=UPI0019667F62|nr:hypothetical protein [Azonexus hydrophilus]